MKTVIFSLFCTILGLVLCPDPSLSEPGKWWAGAGFIFLGYIAAAGRLLIELGRREVARSFWGDSEG